MVSSVVKCSDCVSNKRINANFLNKLKEKKQVRESHILHTDKDRDAKRNQITVDS